MSYPTPAEVEEMATRYEVAGLSDAIRELSREALYLRMCGVEHEAGVHVGYGLLWCPPRCPGKLLTNEEARLLAIDNRKAAGR